MLKDLIQIPNLLSLSRIFMVPFIWYFLASGGKWNPVYCLLIIGLAGITDGLDGYLARKLNKVSRLGLILDPLSDKVMALAIVGLLIFYRDFPVWLASIIIGRDLLIIIAGSTLVKKNDLIIPSNLTGKYAFASITLLLGSYISYFDFGIVFCMAASLIFIFASLINYFRVFIRVRNGKEIIPFKDNKFMKNMRTVAASIVTLIIIYKLYWHLLENYIN